MKSLDEIKEYIDNFHGESCQYRKNNGLITFMTNVAILSFNILDAQGQIRIYTPWWELESIIYKDDFINFLGFSNIELTSNHLSSYKFKITDDATLLEFTMMYFS